MLRALLQDVWPYLALLGAALVGLHLVVRYGGRRETQYRRRLANLHGDQQGAVQSFSFVLTVPLFIMFMLLIVQLSQIMIGMMTVHYAAFAAARAAIVWIPAHIATAEPVNPVEFIKPEWIGAEYRVIPGTTLHSKIQHAAVLACAPVAPSRDLPGFANPREISEAASAYYAYSLAVAPHLANNGRVPARISNKLRYSAAATQLDLRYVSPIWDRIPPIYYPWVGWQDQVRATVTHDFALLPGPARVFARRVGSTSATTSDGLSQVLRRRNAVYTIPLTATCTLGNEGETSARNYVYHPE
jgi:hypothetical protein